MDDLFLIDVPHAVARGDALDDLLDDEPVDEFSEEEVVRLHWWLLQKVRLLAVDTTPLAEKFELVRWMFTDPEHDRMPFSFVSCLRVAACSPLSLLPFMGACNPEEIRDWIAARLRRWFDASLAAYPAWVRHAVVAHPDWAAAQLEANPQWINEQMRRHHERSDLFS